MNLVKENETYELKDPTEILVMQLNLIPIENEIRNLKISSAILLALAGFTMIVGVSDFISSYDTEYPVTNMSVAINGIACMLSSFFAYKNMTRLLPLIQKKALLEAKIKPALEEYPTLKLER